MPLHPESLIESAPARPAASASRLRLLALCTAVLVLCFAWPLFGLVRLALHSDLYSHVLLIPFVSLYLVWVRRGQQRIGRDAVPRVPISARIPIGLTAIPLAAGLVSIIGYVVAICSGLKMAPVDSLAWTTFSFFLFFVGVCFFCLDRQTLRAAAFPIGFLIFMVPFPVVVRDAIEAFLQHASADAAALFFGLVGTPFLRQDVAFQLPGFSLEVAPECSGIRSTLVLFISSLIAGQMFLRSPWKRALFALAVIPLGILRNGFRIVVIGELCVHVDPAFIDSPLHHRGGPIFFVISLVPFLLLLWWLWKTENRKRLKAKG